MEILILSLALILMFIIVDIKFNTDNILNDLKRQRDERVDEQFHEHRSGNISNEHILFENIVSHGGFDPKPGSAVEYAIDALNDNSQLGYYRKNCAGMIFGLENSGEATKLLVNAQMLDRLNNIYDSEAMPSIIQRIENMAKDAEEQHAIQLAVENKKGEKNG